MKNDNLCMIAGQTKPDEYGNETLGIIDLLKKDDLNINNQQGSIVLHVAKMPVPKKLKHFTRVTSHIVSGALQPDENKKSLAKRLNTNAASLSTGSSARKITRNLALVLLMSQKKLPTADEAGHILMQLGHPGLFVSTARNDENRRNWILRKILEHAQERPDGYNNWLEFTNLALAHLGMPQLSRHISSTSLTEDDKRLCESWRNSFPVSYNDFTAPRHKYLKLFREISDLDGYGGKTEAFCCLQNKANEIWNQSLGCNSSEQERITDETIRNMFGTETNENTHVSRDVLICVSIALGCTLEQTNNLLFDDHRALLYPNQSNQQEVYWVRCLCENENSPLAQRIRELKQNGR